MFKGIQQWRLSDELNSKRAIDLSLTLLRGIATFYIYLFLDSKRAIDLSLTLLRGIATFYIYLFLDSVSKPIAYTFESYIYRFYGVKLTNLFD